jgi:hypothetical protein
VINVPARGIGKGVMDAVDAIAVRHARLGDATADARVPLLAGLQPTLSAIPSGRVSCTASTIARSRIARPRRCGVSRSDRAAH